MNRSGVRRAVAGIVVAGVLLAAGDSQALHRVVPLFLQVADVPSTVIGAPHFSERSNLVLFHSDGDFLGNGNSVPQIFLFDLAARAKRNEQAIYQLTFGTLGSYEPTAARRARVIAFESEADLLGDGSTGRQVFVSRRAKWSKGILPLLQVTKGLGESYGPVLSTRRGEYLVFFSTGDLTGAGLAPGPHVYRADLDALERSGCPGYPCPAQGNAGLTLVSPETVDHPDVDRTGGRVVFASEADAAGTGCGVGVSQIFLKDFPAGTVEQLTCGAAPSRNPVFTRSYHGVLFESDADLAQTGSTHTQIFSIDLRATPQRLTQMTFGTDGDSIGPAPNGTRGKIRFFFTSTADITGAGPSATPRLYEFDESRGFAMLTSSQDIESSYAGQFTFAAFASDSDFVGNGNHQPQLFIINSFPAFGP
jgi:hypothetical protein